MSIKSRPILFNSEMVRAILAGRKTQTRRVIKPQPPGYLTSRGKPEEMYPNSGIWGFYAGNENARACRSEDTLCCPYGAAGGLLWVRETWGVNKDYDNLSPTMVWVATNGDTKSCVDYKATPRNEDWTGKWRQSIHMPRWASRINLGIKNIRIERIQDITEEDAWQEGIQDRMGKETPLKGELLPVSVHAFASLWEKINNTRGYGWKTNPWVWVVEFKRVGLTN